MEEQFYDTLEQAISELEASAKMDEVITKYPHLKTELETVSMAKSISSGDVPSTTLHRSRILVLSRAAQLRQESRSGWGLFRKMPQLVYALVLAFVFLLSWSGLATAAGQALPGDQLYPAKLTLERIRLGLTIDQHSHQIVEEEYQSRRLDEVVQLLELGRVEFVEFFGVVDQQGDVRWIIGGVDVHLQPETIIIGEIFPEMMVEVEGATQPEGWVQASEIHLQTFTLTGIVESISETLWQIEGREIEITPETEIDSKIGVGDQVVVTVRSDDFGKLTAEEIELIEINDPNDLSTSTPEPTDDDSDQIEETPENDDGDDEDDKETPEPDETDEPDDPDETDEPDEPDEIDEMDEPDETDKPDETDD